MDIIFIFIKIIRKKHCMYLNHPMIIYNSDIHCYPLYAKIIYKNIANRLFMCYIIVLLLNLLRCDPTIPCHYRLPIHVTVFLAGRLHQNFHTLAELLNVSTPAWHSVSYTQCHPNIPCCFCRHAVRQPSPLPCRCKARAPGKMPQFRQEPVAHGMHFAQFVFLAA